jgi:glycerol-3-phosphate acyltransferase PlsY
MILAAVLIAIAYLLGSVPFALVVGKGIFRVDVRKGGSGNIGTTNVFRVLGTKAGLLVFAGDFAKGFLPVFAAAHIFELDNAALVTVLVAGAAIAGHNWSIFLRGRGGKGVATGGGAVLAMMPWLFLLAFAVFWLVLLIDRRVSVASLSAATGLSVATLTTGQPRAYIAFAWLGAAVVFYAHRSNLQRLARGEESRVNLPWGKDSGGRGGAAGQQKTGPTARDERAATELTADEDFFTPLKKAAGEEKSSFDYLKGEPLSGEPAMDEIKYEEPPLSGKTEKIRLDGGKTASSKSSPEEKKGGEHVPGKTSGGKKVDEGEGEEDDVGGAGDEFGDFEWEDPLP